MTATTADTSVLIAGAGPVDLAAAVELARRGIDFRIVAPLLDPPLNAKAVGVQPRTLEIFEGMGPLFSLLSTREHALPLYGAEYETAAAAAFLVRPDG